MLAGENQIENLEVIPGRESNLSGQVYFSREVESETIENGSARIGT